MIAFFLFYYVVHLTYNKFLLETSVEEPTNMMVLVCFLCGLILLNKDITMIYLDKVSNETKQRRFYLTSKGGNV